MYRLLACLAVTAFAGPATACLNDLELPTHEREFRSQYKSPAAPPQVPDPPYRISPGLIFGAGAVLMTSAVALTLIGPRTRRS
ncbi:MAG: hypothetical protein JWO38_6212 [Gemmataceae bacterium]|nr:hypothetical protein [Gemmataceae bacterium]